jgi:broad specificity phosphatase PhoE
MDVVTPRCLPLRPFFYLRHGQTEWNATGLIQGHSDVPLNATGHAQATHAAAQLVGLGITHIVASPLQRALVTAQVVQGMLGVELHTDANLAEWNFGALEGQHRDVSLTAAGQPLDGSILDILPPDAETQAQVTIRALTAVQQALANPSAVPLLVGHGALLKALAEALNLNQTGRFGNAQPYRLVPTGGAWQLEIVGTPTAGSGCALAGQPLRRVA